MLVKLLGPVHAKLVGVGVIPAELNTSEPPTQTALGAVRLPDVPFTVTLVVNDPQDVNEIIAVPGVIPLTTPVVGFTLAIAELPASTDQVPELGTLASVVVEPAHTEAPDVIYDGPVLLTITFIVDTHVPPPGYVAV